MSKPNSTLSAERCRDLLNYDPETGVFVWRVRTSSRAGQGDVAGSVMGTGYIQIKVGGGRYLAHRLAWLWVYGTWPDGDIDHIDGVATNNAIRNLRNVDHTINMQNLKTARSNNLSSGLLGVYPNKKRWGAKITINRTVHLLGTHDTPEEAHQAYLGAKRLIHPGCTI